MHDGLDTISENLERLRLVELYIKLDNENYYENNLISKNIFNFGSFYTPPPKKRERFLKIHIFYQGHSNYNRFDFLNRQFKQNQM